VIAYLDCSTGVSGDKFLGALVDAGFDLQPVRDALASMGLEHVTVTSERRVSGGLSCIGVTVSEPGAPVRQWRDIRSLVERAAVPDEVRDAALRALTTLAEAEARYHGVPLDEVHFHEIGAADTIADVLGVALALHEANITSLVASPVAVGSGTVITAHGELPVPAPAASLLLEGLPVVPGTAGGELTTPTGAALLRTFVESYGLVPPMVVRRIGVGGGTRDLGMPNVCQVLIGEPIEEEPGYEDIVLLETNLDHLTPEEVAVAADRLRKVGALDVWQSHVYMKKGRAATMLSVLTRTADVRRMADRIITETGTLGVRIFPAARRLVERDVTEIVTSLGTARFKTAYLPDGRRVLRVESDDAARVAAEHGLSIGGAARLLEAEASRITGVQPMRQWPASEDTSPSD
jgi:uncharacterized protein (TIGR00299 family) protein